VYVHGGSKRASCVALVTYLAALLTELTARPHLWSHVAECYLEATLATFHALQRSLPPGKVLPPAATRAVTCLLCHVIGDRRVVSPYMKEVMLSSVNTLFSHAGYLRAIESDPPALERLVPTLLGAYSQELWMQLSTILTRLLEGTGFGQPPDAAKGSAALRRRLARACLERSPEATRFVDQLFGALNWAVTELAVAARDGDLAAAALQRRQTVLFEFAAQSCRLLEFLFVAAPLLFTSGPRIHAARLCEMLAFVVAHAGPCEERGARSDGDRAAHSLHLLAPVVSVLMYAWHLEFRGGFEAAADGAAALLAPAPPPAAALEHSVVHMVANMKEACSTERLAALADCAWGAAFEAGWEATTPGGCGLCYGEFLAWVSAWREGGGDVAEVVPDDFLDPIMMCVMEVRVGSRVSKGCVGLE